MVSRRVAEAQSRGGRGAEPGLDARDRRGLGLGRAMGEASLERARALGYAAMQFNIVVSTNHAAVRLWRSLGFRVLGTVPGGFRLPSGERVDHHIMFREL